MILTYKIKHNKDFSAELSKAHKVAEYALRTGSLTSKDVKHLGLKSMIVNQVLKKYAKNKTIKKVNKVKLAVPNQGIKVKDDKIILPCLKLELPIFFPKNFTKINQVEIGSEYAYISASFPEPVKFLIKKTIGVDRNTTHHSIVASCLETGKILKLGKSCNHIHKKYKNMRKTLQKQGKLKKVKQIKDRESRIVRDTNHKISKALVLFAKENDACLVLEDLKDIRQTAKTRRKGRYSLHSWSYYQQKMFVEYKAKKFGVEVFFVAPQYTSQRCSICGHIEQANRKGNIFHCVKCGVVEDSGVNAGFNIASLYRQGIPQFNKERDLLKGRTDTPKEATA